MTLQRKFLLAVVAGLSLTALIAIYSLLFGFTSEVDWKVMATTALVGSFSLAGMGNAAVLERGGKRGLAWAGIVVSALGFSLFEFMVLFGAGGGEGIWKAAFLSTFFAVALTHTGLLLLAHNRTAWMTAVLAVGVASLWTVTVLLSYAVLAEPHHADWLWRATGIAAIFGTVCTISAPLLHRRYKHAATDTDATNAAPMPAASLSPLPEAFPSLLRKRATDALLVTLVLTAIVGIVELALGSWSWIEVRILLSTALVAAGCLAILCNAFVLESRPNDKMAGAGIVFAVLAMALTLALIWKETADDWLWQAGGSLMVAAVAVAHVGLMRLTRKGRVVVERVASATIAAIFTTAGVTILLILTEGADGEFLFYVLGVAAILDGLGTLATPILSKAFPTPQK